MPGCCRPPVQAPAGPSALHPEEAQTQPQAPDALHHAAAQRAGEEVPGEAVLEHRRARRVLRPAQAHRDPGQDLVPEPARQDQAAPGVGAGAAEVRLGAAHAAPLRHPPVPAPRRPQQLQPPPRLPRRLHARLGAALLPLSTFAPALLPLSTASEKMSSTRQILSEHGPSAIVDINHFSGRK